MFPHGKVYKPEDIRSPYFIVPFLLLVIGIGLYDEIDEIVPAKKIEYTIALKNKNGKKVFANTVAAFADELFNEIIRRAVNCQKIDLRRIKNHEPNLITYEKGL